jgi:hypothetical protein
MGNMGKGLEGFGGDYNERAARRAEERANTAANQHAATLKIMTSPIQGGMWNAFTTIMGQDGKSLTARFMAFVQVRRMRAIGKLFNQLIPKVQDDVAKALLMETDSTAYTYGVAIDGVFDTLGTGPHVVILLPNKEGLIAVRDWREKPGIAEEVERALEDLDDERPRIKDASEWARNHDWKRGPDGKFDFSDSPIAGLRASLERSGKTPEEIREMAIEAMTEGFKQNNGSMPMFGEAAAFFPLANEVRTDEGLRRQLDDLFRVGGFNDFEDFLVLRDKLLSENPAARECSCAACQMVEAYRDGEEQAKDGIGRPKGRC